MAISGEGTGAPGTDAAGAPVSPGGDSGPGGSERRQYDRHAMQVDATVGIQGGPSRACRIQDFCPGGLFLAVEGANGSGIVLGEKTLEINGEPVVTRHYRLSGGYDRELWYDRSNDVLVRVRFKAEDGSQVEYVPLDKTLAARY